VRMTKLADKFKNIILSKDLEKTNDEIASTIVDVGESALDVFQEETYKEIPILKYIMLVPKTVHGVQDRLMAKKILVFATALTTASLEQRTKFIEELSSDKREKIFEKIYMTLQAATDVDRAQIVGQLFEAYIRGVLNETQFNSAMHAANMIDLETIDDLHAYYAGNDNIPGEKLDYFAGLRLVNTKTEIAARFNSTNLEYERNTLGNLFCVYSQLD